MPATAWHLNRNNLRLSTAVHVRAMHRRRTISEAQAAGITHFRLDVPKAYLPPRGILAQHAWRVRTLEEWVSIERTLNRGRVSASAFDSLGFFHNDPSYVIPVPPEFLDEARRHGEALRRRWGLA